MTPPNCPRCGLPRRNLAIPLLTNYSLDFIICSNHHFQTTNLEELFFELLRVRPSRGHRYLAHHLDRYIDTLNLIPVYHSSGKALDVGSGARAFLARLIRGLFGYDIKCIDISKNFYAPPLSYTRCNLDQDVMPFVDDSFIIITMTEVIEHLENPLNALREINRVLKPGGKLIISTPNIGRFTNMIREVRGLEPRTHGLGEFQPSQVQQMVEYAGLSVQEIVFSNWSERKWMRLSFSQKSMERVPMLTRLYQLPRYVAASAAPSLSSYFFLLCTKSVG